MNIGYQNICGNSCAICGSNVEILEFAEDPENAIEFTCQQCLPDGKLVVHNTAFTPAILKDPIVLEHLKRAIHEYNKETFTIAGWSLYNATKIISGNASNRSYVGLFGHHCLFCGSQIQILTDDQIDGFTFKCLECNNQEPIGITGSIMRVLKEEPEFKDWCYKKLNHLRGLAAAKKSQLSISTDTYKIFKAD